MADSEKRARERYAELVDKRFCSALSESETAELQRLEARLDEAEAKLYEPVVRELESTLKKLCR
jgi:hypothetical protein